MSGRLCFFYGRDSYCNTDDATLSDRRCVSGGFLSSHCDSYPFCDLRECRGRLSSSLRRRTRVGRGPQEGNVRVLTDSPSVVSFSCLGYRLCPYSGPRVPDTNLPQNREPQLRDVSGKTLRIAKILAYTQNIHFTSDYPVTVYVTPNL